MSDEWTINIDSNVLPNYREWHYVCKTIIDYWSEIEKLRRKVKRLENKLKKLQG